MAAIRRGLAALERAARAARERGEAARAQSVAAPGTASGGRYARPSRPSFEGSGGARGRSTSRSQTALATALPPMRTWRFP